MADHHYNINSGKDIFLTLMWIHYEATSFSGVKSEAHFNHHVEHWVLEIKEHRNIIN